MSSRLARATGFLRSPLPAGDALVAAAPAVPIREVFRRFWPYARQYRGRLAITLALVVVAPAIATAEIALFKETVDRVLVPRDFGLFLWIALAFIGLSILAGLVSFCDDYLSTWIGERFLLSLRTSVFRHVQGLSLDFFERRRLGDVVSRLTGDIASIESLILSGVAGLLSNVLRILFFVGALFYLRWELALVALTVAPLFWWVASHFSRSIKHASREKRRRTGSISAVAEESLGNAPLVQAYNRQAWELERFQRQNAAIFQAQMASTRLKALFMPLVDVIEVMGALTVIGVGTLELSRERLTLGGLLAFLAFLSQLYSPIRGLSRLSGTVSSATAGAERIIELLDERPSVVERSASRELGRALGVVEFDDVSFRYPGADRDAVSGISFRLEPGEILALVGPSGGGKSTLAKLLLRFHDPAAGTVRVDGADVRDLSVHSLRENVALLLQETLVFHGTIRENIAYGRPEASREEIVQAAKASAAHTFIRALPEGYETVVGQRGRRLSGGQRQRIAIARAIIRDAPILVLDEPTSALDAESGSVVLELLYRLMENRSTIVISHNLLTVREATSILVLEEGAVSEHGTHPELLARGGTYARLSRSHQARPAAHAR